jgi:hypothetical protein
VPHHIGIQDHRHPLHPIVDQGERGNRSRRYAEHLHQQVGLAEAQAVAAEPLVQRLEVNLGMPQRHDKEQAVFLVLEEQVLGVPAWQLALQARALRHGEHRLMIEGLALDAELGEPGNQVLAGGRQGGHRDGWKRPASPRPCGPC